MHLDAEKEMMSQCVALLGKFIAVREPNIRYLGLVSYGNTTVLISLMQLMFKACQVVVCKCQNLEGLIWLFSSGCMIYGLI